MAERVRVSGIALSHAQSCAFQNCDPRPEVGIPYSIQTMNADGIARIHRRPQSQSSSSSTSSTGATGAERLRCLPLAPLRAPSGGGVAATSFCDGALDGGLRQPAAPTGAGGAAAPCKWLRDCACTRVCVCAAAPWGWDAAWTAEGCGVGGGGEASSKRSEGAAAAADARRR